VILFFFILITASLAYQIGFSDDLVLQSPAASTRDRLSAGETTLGLAARDPSSCARAPNGFSRSFLRLGEFFAQNDAILCNAARMLNRRIRSVGNPVQSSEMMRNSLGLNYKSAALSQLSDQRISAINRLRLGTSSLQKME
jgi:hypothetical protein